MAWRRWLGFLTLYESAALVLAPLERITPERVRRYTRHLAETNTAYSVACQFDTFYSAARTVFPQTDWSWLRKIKARLFAIAPNGARKGPVISSLQLVELGFELMGEADLASAQHISMADAVKYRDGLIIALFGYVPIRHKNMAGLEIGRDFLKESSSWSIVIPAEDSKTKSAIEFAVPEALREQFAVYLKRVRPRILRIRGCRALWVSPKGGPLSYSALGPVLTRHTTERLGVRISPHDARDAAATTWAIVAPEQIGVARDLLGHTDLKITTKHYNRARGVEASRAHHELIAQMRSKRRRMT
jgi:integrase